MTDKLVIVTCEGCGAKATVDAADVLWPNTWICPNCERRIPRQNKEWWKQPEAQK